MPDHPTQSLSPHIRPTANPSIAGRTADPAATTGSETSTISRSEPPRGAERYDLGREIARGGMGVIYLATDTILGREVAIKVLAEKYVSASATARRFTDEACIAAQLQHPAIPPVHDLGTLPDGRPFLAMKLIKGSTLEDLLIERSSPGHDRGRFVAVFEQVCQALAFAHDRKVIHRDLKPANIMVGNFGEVQVMDWGLAKVLSASRSGEETSDVNETTGGTEIHSLRESDGSFTQAGTVLGTPAFMPPEQAVGAVNKVDARSDVFGLGAVLAVILTGRPPFAASSAETTRVRAATGDLADCFARLDGSAADPELVALCKRCLSPRPTDRPADAGEVAQAVAALRAVADERARQAELDRVRLEGEKTAADVRLAEQRRRARLRLVLAGLVGVLVLAGGAFAWLADQHETRRRVEAEDRNRDERERRARNAMAVASLLDQAEEALRSGDAARASVLLDAAGNRAYEGGADAEVDRLADRRDDLTTLREFDAIDRFRWVIVDNQLPKPAEVAERFRVGLRRIGVDPETVSPDEAAVRVSRSAVRDRLVFALDWVLATGPSLRVLATLRAADPHPFRDAVRNALVAGNKPLVAELAAAAAAADQPPWFVSSLTETYVIPLERRRALIESALLRRAADLGLLIELGNIHYFGSGERRGESVRWYQAAVAVAPGNAAVWYKLGHALADVVGDWDGAAGAFREAIRLEGATAVFHLDLRNALFSKGDTTSAVAAAREAVRLNPGSDWAYLLLAGTLSMAGDTDGAVATIRDAIRLLPEAANLHSGLGNFLFSSGDLVHAAASYREAVRLDPKHERATGALAQVERLRPLALRLPGVIGGTDRPASPSEALAFAELCRQPFQRRFAASARLCEEAFAAQPTLADDTVRRDRYNATCCAALAAAGQDRELAAFGVEEWGHLTGLALKWLRADLAELSRKAMDPAQRQDVRMELTSWRSDWDLIPIRDPKWLAVMTPTDRRMWESLWADVDALIAATSSPKPGPKK